MTDVFLGDNQKEAQLSDYFALLKPRVMSLVVFTAAVGLIAAPGSLHPFEAFCAILFIAIGAGASGALNMWWDADIDSVMRRTRRRPVPAGVVSPEEALYLGVALSGFSVIMLGLATNLLAAGLLAFTIVFYAVIYSMWLKRSTPQNIVIGGAAGAFPPVIGWAAVTGGTSIEPWLMFALIFLWTPPHFWSLALFMKSDYDDASVPMLTVTHGRKSTRAHIMAYSVVLVVFSLAAAFTSVGGPMYLLAALVLNAMVISGAVRIWKRSEQSATADGYKVERSFFKLSLLYLFVHFLAFAVEAFSPYALGGPAWL